MHIAVVDDEKPYRGILISYIARVPGLRERGCSVSEFESGEEFLSAAGREKFDLIFMDIYMGGASGVDTARRYRQLHGDCPLVFTTSSREHALEAYKLHALQYLLKPYDEAEVFGIFEELDRRLPRPEKFIELKTGRTDTKVKLREILWADNYQHQVHIHLENGVTVSGRISFGDFCALVKDDSRFFVCGRGLLVNLAKVSDFDGRSFYLGATQLPVSRQYTGAARSAFADWLFRNSGR